MTSRRFDPDRQPVLVLNPASDLTFRMAGHIALAEQPASPAGLAAQLRSTYPAVVVRPRELSGEPTVVWYVYREGRWDSDRPPPLAQNTCR